MEPEKDNFLLRDPSSYLGKLPKEIYQELMKVHADGPEIPFFLYKHQEKLGFSKEMVVENASIVNCIAYEPIHNMLATSNVNKIQVWDLSTKVCIFTLDGQSYTICMQINKNNNTLITGHENGSIKIWNLSTGNCDITIDAHSDTVSCLALDLENNILFSASNCIRAWDLGSGALLKEFDGHNDITTTLKKDPQGCLISTSLDGSLKIWNIQTGECQQTIENELPITFFDKSSSYMVVACHKEQNTHFKIWDLKQNSVKTFTIDRLVNNLKIDQANNRLFIVANNTLHLVDLENNEFQSHTKLNTLDELYFDIDHQSIIVTSMNGQIKQWHLENTALKQELWNSLTLDQIDLLKQVYKNYLQDRILNISFDSPLLQALNRLPEKLKPIIRDMTR